MDEIINKHNKPKIKLSELHNLKSMLRKHSLNTVCEQASCPNISTCFSKKVATILIMGDRCTRDCSFCNILSKKPFPLDSKEPENIVKLVEDLKIKHLVLTSVTRDDIDDGGASHFVSCIRAVKRKFPATTIEVLTPDFRLSFKALELVLNEDIVIFNHNVEMVSSLYENYRKGASFEGSMLILKRAKEYLTKYKTKSGFMVGLGESFDEIKKLINELSCVNLDILTIGQYYSPSKKHARVKKIYSNQEFKEFEKIAKGNGIKNVYSASNVRSSFNADQFV